MVGISDLRIGGAQKILVDLLHHIDRNKYEIHLITFFEPLEEESFYDSLPIGIKVYRLNFNRFVDPISLYQLFKAIREIKPHIVWSHLFFSNTLLRLFKVFFSYKVVTVEHNTYVNKSKPQIFFDRILSPVTDKIVAVSPGVAEFTSSQEKISLEKFAVIPNGIDIHKLKNDLLDSNVEDLKTELRLEPHHKLIISVGQLIQQKNHRYLIGTFKEFLASKPDYRLLILGEGPLRAQLESQIEALSLQEKVFLPGIKKKISPYLSMAHFFVLPSAYEGFGIVCIEALAMGLPVITTRVTGPDSYIIEGENGFFVDGEESDLLKKMLLLSNIDDDSYKKLSESAIKTAENYSIESVARQYQRLFQDILKVR